MSGFHDWASTPPMGWSSRGSLAAQVTEARIKAQADYMAMALARFGWQYIVVELRLPAPQGGDVGGRRAPPPLDGHGRSLPAPDRFPSCAGGFQPLAGYVHALGLRFGLRLQRGVPRAAVDADLPILGTQLTARDIASADDAPPRHPDMRSIDVSKPGAQEYYDSVFAALATWGVDYVEVEDIAPHYLAHQAEIESIRRAIDRAGRPMVLSLSPGPTPLAAAQHVVRHANLWGVGDQPGNDGDDVRERSARLHDWSRYRAPGRWPDAGPLLLGGPDLAERPRDPGESSVADRGATRDAGAPEADEYGTGLGPLERPTRASPDRARTLLTLWAIARSPLLLVGDMTQMDDGTRALLTNREVIALVQDSRDNRLLFDADGLFAWVATASSGREHYLALFNTRDRWALTEERALANLPLEGGRHAFQTSFLDVPVRPGMLVQLVADDGPGSGGDHHAVVWGEPVLLGPAGELSILDLPWQRATSRSGSVRLQRAANESALLLGGRPLDRGILVHTKSVIAFRVPTGYDRLVVECGFEGASLPVADGVVARCIAYGETREGQEKPGERDGETAVDADARGASSAAGLPISVPLADLGIAGGEKGARAHDVWTGADLGACEAVFTRTIPWHGAGLFRISRSAR